MLRLVTVGALLGLVNAKPEIDGMPMMPRSSKGRYASMRMLQSNASNATSDNATAAPTTAAPGTAPPTTAAPTAAPATQAPATQATATQAPATQAPATKAPVEEKTEAPKATTMNLSNTTDVSRVSVALEMKISLDISGMSADVKKAAGQSIAYGIHASACDTVSDLWTTMLDCMMGKGTTDGVTFDMALTIDAQLGSNTYGCTSWDNCYGGSTPAPARQLAAVELTNSADFGVTAQGSTEVLRQVATAKAALDTASATAATGGSFSAASILANVEKAMTRPTMNATLGDAVAAIRTAVAAATVTAAVSEVAGATVAPLPAAAGTSGSTVVSAAGAIAALVAGALLF